MKGRIGSSMSMERKAMRAYYKAAAEAGRSKRKHQSPLGKSQRVVVIPPTRKTA